MQNTTHTKLQAIDEKLKRWHSRMTRAHNAIVKLNRARKRITNPKLMADYDAYVARAVEETVKCLPPPKSEPLYKTMPAAELESARAASQELNDAIPVILQRSYKQPVSDEERKKMPLSGREAEAFIKARSAKVTAKRAKKELRLRP